LQILIALCIIAAIIIAVVILFTPGSGPAPVVTESPTVHLKILAINDFHGQLPDGQKLNKRPAGSAPVLASYLRTEMEPAGADGIIVALPGDIVGASPPESGLLLDEPALLYFNGYANSYCAVGSEDDETSCNMVAGLGNHEFDKGIPELMRKIDGGNGAASISRLVEPYPGSRSTYTCANVVWKSNNTPILPPWTLRTVNGVPVAFIGAVSSNTQQIPKSAHIDDLVFLDEAESINRYIPEIHAAGIHTIIVLLHEGGTQDAYTGPTRSNTTVTGRVAEIVPRLDPDVDVVLSGHTHAFTNAYLNNAGGNPVLVTQAWSYSRGYADIDLIINRTTGEIVQKSAEVIPAYADQGPGTSPDPETAAFLAAGEKMVEPEVEELVGRAAFDITREKTTAGESAMGDMVVDSQRAAMKADAGFSSAGSVRADLMQGTITWGNLYAVQPFANTVVSMTLSGDQIRRVLERQWEEPLPPYNLMVSGIVYTYDPVRPAGSRVVNVTINNRPLDPKADYTVSMADFLAGGGDGYTMFREGTNITNGPMDIDALVAYTESLPQPVNVTTDGRIRRIG
jgi:5'-nucleotidase